jgi:decaprenylphospho-beta-D-ribofuranose 2-oxidase
MPSTPRNAMNGKISGWGRIFLPGHESRSEDLELASREATLFRGLGRSYGDASLPAPSRREVTSTILADRIRFFGRETGSLRAEAGLALHELNRLFLARGWFTPVTPGTQFVTLGGMVAADVHGKNHHVDGCFGRHVTGLRMRVADGRIVECSREENRDLFHATLGGMGLTGHILEVEFRMRRVPSPWIFGESEPVRDIDHYVAALKDAAKEWPYTVGWLDCLSRGPDLGRGILFRGRFANPDEAPREAPRPKRRTRVPFVCPAWFLSEPIVRAFNEINLAAHGESTRRGIVHPEEFFYPLDKVLEWNRLYGPRGFTQYQCVLPEAAGLAAARRFLTLLTSRGGASFLCVIKDCGPEGEGLISFPMRGISIALDIAVRDETPALVAALNELVIAEGGRIYLAKDQFTSPEHFRRMEPRLDRFLEVRRKWDPRLRFRSALSVRVFGDPT